MGMRNFPRTLPDGIGAGQSPEDYLHRVLAGMKEAIPRSHDSEMTVPSEQAFSDAHEFISRLNLNGCAMPEIELIGDGEINFSWERDDNNLQITLGFYGTGKYSCFARRDGRAPIYADDIPASAGLREDIRALIRG